MWIPREDSFRFKAESLPIGIQTKRSILSFIARFFDPLGWATPVIITAKILIQELWIRRYDWDSPLGEELTRPWEKYCAEFTQLKEIRIGRWTGMHPQNAAVELHGFADASNRAYAAVVYLRILRSLDEISVVLLTAKSKVAPIKTISVPRLELNAIVLLTRLLDFVNHSLNLKKYSDLRMVGFFRRSRMASKPSLQMEFIYREPRIGSANSPSSGPMESRPIERKPRRLCIARSFASGVTRI